MSRYARRRVTNAVALGLAVATTLFGLFWLVWILWTLLRLGLGGLDLHLFAASTPPPGSDGGLANAIVGSLLMTAVAVVVGAPVGVLAGTYLAEYARAPWLAATVRFVNDILLSAPSILVGLFIYEVMVVRMGHFSGWAGAMALAIIVLPVVVRTTEDMLRLVPTSLREAAAALGAPRWKVTVHGLLPGGPRRHHHRHPARHRPHHRRDRAASVHGAQQPVLEPRPQRARWPTCRW